MSSTADQGTGDSFYRELVDGTQLGVWVLDADEVVTWVNPALCALLDHSPERLLGRHLHELAAEERPRGGKILRPRRAGARAGATLRLARADGRTLRARVWTHPLLDGDGSCRGSVSYIADIGEEQAHAKALEEDRALLAAAVEQIPAGVIVADASMRVRLANREAVSMGIPASDPAVRAGWPRGQQHIRWIVRAPDGGALPPGSLPLTRAVREGVTTVGRELLIDTGSHRRPVLVNAAPVMDGDSLAGGVVVFNDISDRKRAERERDQLRDGLQQAQRLESLGLLAGGIAHDFNNLLAVVIGELELALGDLGDHPACAGIGRALDSARIGAGLTRQILSYAGQAPLDIQPVDLTELTRSMAPLIQAAVARRVRVELAVDGDLPPVLADKGQIQQLLLNLVVNAAEAIGTRRGRLRVQAYETELDEADVRTLHPSTPIEAGSYVCLEVSDDGEGMSEETLARLFDPFFSTRAPGRGLGLSTTLGIVRGHGAGIHVRSSLGRGSTFRVFLPPDTRPPPAPAAARATAPAAPVGDGDLVLVVDDEASVRAVFSAILERFGYRALQADSGDAALAIYRRRREEIALVLLDMTMPGMSGEETCAALLAIQPEARIILCSGYTESQVRQRADPLGVIDFVQKPVRPGTLIEAVRRALSRG